MELFRLEHKKLWRKNSTRICALLCFFYCVICGSFMVYQWMAFGSIKDSAGRRNFDGYRNIRKNQDYARKYEELTDESLQQWVRDYQSLQTQIDEEKRHRVQNTGKW